MRWSPATGERGKSIDFAVITAAPANQATLLATWYPDGFAILRGDTREAIAYAGHKSIAALAVSPDAGRGVALRRWTGRMISSPEGLEPDLVVLDLQAKTSKVLPIAVDAVAVANADTAVAQGTTLAHLVDDQLVAFATAAAPVTSLAYSGDGRVLAVGGGDGSIAIYAGAQRIATRSGARRGGAPARVARHGPGECG